MRKASLRWPIIGLVKAVQVFAETSTGPGMKSLSCGMKTEPPSRGYRGQAFRCGFALLLFLDEADVAAALEAREGDGRSIAGLRVEPEVFFKIVPGDQSAPERLPIDFAVAD